MRKIASVALTATDTQDTHGEGSTRRPCGGEDEGSVVGAGDAIDDGQTEADACVVAVYAFGAALERRDRGGNQVGGERRPGIFTVGTTDSELTPVVIRTVRCLGRLWTMAL